MNLAIFDIDGTLTNTSKIDAECYVRAFRNSLGIDVENGNWESFLNYTDEGIAEEIIARAFQRPATPEELDRLKSTFYDLLEAAQQTNPEQFLEIPGAAKTLQRLKQDPDWVVAIATGCWEKSALLKLHYAGIPADGTPLAHCDHHIEREKIILKAVKLAEQKYNVTKFDKTVYIGDGLWDIRTTRKLNIPFVGIAYEKPPEPLQDAGAVIILPHYKNYAEFVQALTEAKQVA